MDKKWKVSLIVGFLILLAFLALSVGWRVYQTDIRGISSATPPSEKWLFENSDVIAYIEVLEVDRPIQAENSEPLIPEGYFTNYPKQQAKIKFLKVLKGPKDLEGTTQKIIKGRTKFYLSENERVVLHLKKWVWSYHTFREGWEADLAYSLAEANSRAENKGSGLVIEVDLPDKSELEKVRIHILQGHHKEPVILDSTLYKDNLVTSIKGISEFGIVEIPLKPGYYTVLIESNGTLCSPDRLPPNRNYSYRPYVILEENGRRSWESRSLDKDDFC